MTHYVDWSDMWFSKKTPPAPSPEPLEDFVKWLLRYSPDFAELRHPYSQNLDGFVEVNWLSVRDDIQENKLTSKEALLSRAAVMAKSYAQNFKPGVDANGGLEGLPSAFQAGAVMVFVKMSVFLYLLKHRYGVPIPEDMLGMTKLK